MRTLRVWPLVVCVLAGCGSADKGHSGDAPTYTDPGAPVKVSAPTKAGAAYGALSSEVEQARALSPAAFASKYDVKYAKELGYDPLKASNLDLVQKSSFMLGTEQLDVLAKTGLVIEQNKAFPYFLDGLTQIYAEDLPVYVSADAVLDALHHSYDDILKSTEREALGPYLSQLLDALRERLGKGGGSLGKTRADLDLYLSVAKALLEGGPAEVIAGADQDTAQTLVELATKADGVTTVQLFGVKRDEDFSQYKPRGHYADEPVLQRYFRAMMWLGRLDFRLIETQGDGSQLLHRRQVEAMFALADLFDDKTLALFTKIDSAIREFVGESDYMGLAQVPALEKALGMNKLADVEKLSDQALAQTIINGNFGLQRIASYIMTNDGNTKTLPLNRSFALLGQRYVVDSHVFSNVVYDRVPERLMPDPLDVAFAALGNNQAGTLLALQLDQYKYQGALAAMRVAVDAHEPEYWTSTLYTSWLDALRGLSPAALPDTAPALMHTEPWGRRVLNAQLGSWAELRHDTILYAKQSYTDGVACAFPDAYVDPYPAFWAALVRYQERGLALTDALDGSVPASLVDTMREHFTTSRDTLKTLQAMAEQELTGVPFSADQLAFINDAIRIDPNSEGACGEPPTYVGWYTRLFFKQSAEFDPTIADVHTQPTDAAGNEVGRVLHVGTSQPRAFVATLDTCDGPKAYVGVALSYHEVVTEQFERLTDDAWTERIYQGAPAEVPWLAPVLK